MNVEVRIVVAAAKGRLVVDRSRTRIWSERIRLCHVISGGLVMGGRGTRDDGGGCQNHAVLVDHFLTPP